MISKKYIKKLEFETIEDFFNYVVDSKINGNYTQTKEFIKRMSGQQFLLFLQFIDQYNELDKQEFIKMRVL